MFRQRTSAQKPDDDMLANFRQQFPEVGLGTSTCATALAARTTTAGQTDVVGPVQERTQSLGHEAFRDQDPTPRPSNDPWGFTPSMLDPNSFSFSNFANQPPGYYAATPGGTNTLYHPQAGDLHTPSLGLSVGMGLNTPLSMPTSEGSMHPVTANINPTAFQHDFQPPPFQPFNPFVHAPPPQQAFAPSNFVHQDTAFEATDQDGSPVDSDPAEDRVASIDGTFQGLSPSSAGAQAGQRCMRAAVPPPTPAQNFRFLTRLNAPTAMIKHADEIPVTYLNKGQAYSLSIVDSVPPSPASATRYRTCVRVSFEDERQREKPGVCWSLWKEGRGTNEAHQRGGKLQAVEFVEAGQAAEGDDGKPRVEVEVASFDGFSVLWTTGTSGAAECNIGVRFNFLSTDFSHSKGVKGIPVRLCAKTQPLPPAQDQSTVDGQSAEICYCKVKLFRDHGAERKLSNDVSHVKKTMDKLKQQIAQAESGVLESGKRKRSLVYTKNHDVQRPGKVQKHKRTWSISSASSAGGGRMSVEDNLHYKLQTMQHMFTSTRPLSLLSLRGDELDDPDLHPVSLPGEGPHLVKPEVRESAAWRSERSSIAGSLVSPSPSSLSLQSAVSVTAPNAPWHDQRVDSLERTFRQVAETPARVRQTDDAGNLTGWIEALGVDPAYRPPPRQAAHPVACFYIARQDSYDTSSHRLHCAIYLMQRTLGELIGRIAAKWNLDGERVIKVVHVLKKGLEVAMDDDVIREISEGQDMLLDVTQVDTLVKAEWEMAVDATDEGEGNMVSVSPPPQSGYVFRLTF